MMKGKYIIITALLFAMLLVFADSVEAQCAMCKAGAESSLKNGSTRAMGLNQAILYLMSFPYIMGGVFVFIWYRNKKKKERASLEI